MRRRLFTLCSALSLLLCAAVCVLWARSMWVAELWVWSNGTAGLLVESESGRLRLIEVSVIDMRPRGWHWTELPRPRAGDAFPGPPNWPGPVTTRRNVLAARYHAGPVATAVIGTMPTNTSVRTGRYWAWELPHPVAAGLAAAAALPAALLKALRRRRGNERQRSGLCPRCGYDRRASPARCPECGEAVCAAPQSSPRSGANADGPGRGNKMNTELIS